MTNFLENEYESESGNYESKRENLVSDLKEEEKENKKTLTKCFEYEIKETDSEHEKDISSKEAVNTHIIPKISSQEKKVMAKTASANINPLIESTNSEFLVRKPQIITYSPKEFESDPILLPKRLDFKETDVDYGYEISDKVSFFCNKY